MIIISQSCENYMQAEVSGNDITCITTYDSNE